MRRFQQEFYSRPELVGKNTANTKLQRAKASCRQQREIAGLRKLPAMCSAKLQAYESFLQRAARNRRPTKASCNVQREIASLRKLPAMCSAKSQAYESFLPAAA
ncbi:hypothetical protein [Phocaeicola salanitronis]|uniref:hypothetical protein n=1 Tax=Phocaeicola salanitronis TaxID=376805 RepID=UPI0023F7CEDC|nr:hypothetical protein [Phocaeicola salanitronis]